VREINFPGLVRDSTLIETKRQFSPAVTRHLCGRSGRHLSLLTSAAWRTGHWSRTDGRRDVRVEDGPLADFDLQNISHVWIDCRYL